MQVYFIGAGPGDPDLLTLKAHKILSAAKVCIWAGSLVNPGILQVLPEGCVVHDSATLDLPGIMEIIKTCAVNDIDVVRLHTGDPSIYGAINEQMRELEKLGIGYVVVPGISAFQAAAASLKTELTAPEISQAVVITRTSGRTPLPDSQQLADFARTRATLCLYLSAHKIEETCKELIEYYGADCPAAFLYKASWPQEEIKILSTLEQLPALAKETGKTRTAILMVGHALRNCDNDSRLYAPDFKHGFR